MISWISRSHSSVLVSLLTLIICLQKVNASCYGNRNNGDSWYKGACISCQCSNGIIICKLICNKITPQELIRHMQPPGIGLMANNSEKYNEITSSTASDTCLHDSIERQHMETWVENGLHSSTLKENKECMLCHCKHRIVSCTVRFCPPVDCNNPVRKEGSCCYHCPAPSKTVNTKGCSSFGSQFSVDSRWKLYVPKPEINRCFICSCRRNGCRLNAVCEVLTCPPLKCKEYVKKPGHCCKVCKDGSGSAPGLTIYEEEMSNPPEVQEPCKEMQKKRHLEQVKQEKKIKTTTTSKGPKDCTFGKIYKNGEHFIPETYRCLRCKCKDTNVTCGKVMCPRLKCSNPITLDNVCCKVCQNMSREAALKEEDKHVKPLRNNCSKKKRDERIPVFQYRSHDTSSESLNAIYFFDSSQLPNGASEMHSLHMRNNNEVYISILIMTTSVPRFLTDSSWMYIGSIKPKFLNTILRHEKDITSTRSETKLQYLINKIETKSRNGKTSKRGGRCSRNPFHFQFLFKK